VSIKILARYTQGEGRQETRVADGGQKRESRRLQKKEGSRN
jgi:hypothetical protein